MNGQNVGFFTFSDSSWTDSYVYLGSRQIAWLAQANEFFTHFIHASVAGSTTQVTDQAGNLGIGISGHTEDLVWYPFGQEWTNSGSWNDTVFGGMEPYQRNFGLNPTPNRFQSPLLGRWMSPDPMGGDVTNPQSLNRYAYVLNNPTTLTDPLGLNQDCSWDSVTNTLTCPLSGDGDGVGVSPGGCAGLYVNGAYVGSTCGKGTGNQGGGRSGGGGGGGGTLVAQSPLSVRQKGQTFSQCMQQNSNNYSIGGGTELIINALAGTNITATSNPVVNLFTGNGVSSLLFGTPEDQAKTSAGYAPHTVNTAMGSTFTWGRRTTDIFDLNLLGKGGVPQALSSGTRGIKSFLGELDNALSLGMEFTTRLAVDSTLAVGEAIGCQEHSTSSLMVF